MPFIFDDPKKIFDRLPVATGERSTCASLIIYTDFRFEPMARSAAESFSKHHPDVDTFLLGPNELPIFQRSFIKYVSGASWGIGPVKYLIACELMNKLGYTKVICLGADTLTLSRLDEFMDNDSSHVIASLDANTPLGCPFNAHSPEKQLPGPAGSNSIEQEHVTVTPLVDNEWLHLNADVVCFNVDHEIMVRSPEMYSLVNNFLSLFTIIQHILQEKYAHACNHYKEQGLLNFMLFAEVDDKKQFVSYKDLETYEQTYTKKQRDAVYKAYIDLPWRISVVDYPYTETDVIYNIRSIYENDISLPRSEIFDRVSKFYTKDGKVYNREHKHIKILHLRDSITQLPLRELGGHMNRWRMAFSDKVSKHLISSGCGIFFETNWEEWYDEEMEKLSSQIPGGRSTIDTIQGNYKR